MIRNLVFKAARLFWVLPALVLWASFPPAAERTDIFFAFAPLLWFARNREPGRSAKPRNGRFGKNMKRQNGKPGRSARPRSRKLGTRR